ncbi:hypothetical protein K0651_03600 [Ornithinimicrobium sp. Arc0846-15]|nr:hypothetical protein [Ornithinimicrobium laminariae]
MSDAGNLAVGCRADPAVLDRNPLSEGPRALSEGHIVQSMVAGEIAYDEVAHGG